MWPPVASVIWPGWVCVFLAAVSADSETTIYAKLGGEVVLNPGAAFVIGSTSSIVWKDGPNIAIEWDGGTDIILNRQFKERGSLNTSTGEMKLKGLTPTDSGLYKPVINGEDALPIRLNVISSVPVPTVLVSCDDEKTTCTLTCDGDTADAGPFNYTWRSGDQVLYDSSEKQRITKEESVSVNELRCWLENPVSRQSSKPIPNPFITTPGKLNISTGATVFITLLTAVLLMVFCHRWKAGEWFFQKESMPWEADFWRRHGGQPKDAAESNGATTPQEKGQTDEETPMT